MQQGADVADGKEHFTWNGIKVHNSKRGYLDLILASAEHVAGCDRLQGRARLNCVAHHCHVDRTTLLRELAAPEDSMPHWKTLRRFAEGTEVPLGRWLVALEIEGVAGLARALEQETPTLVLTASERAWLDLIRSWPNDESRHHFEYVRRVRGLDLDQT